MFEGVSRIADLPGLDRHPLIHDIRRLTIGKMFRAGGDRGDGDTEIKQQHENGDDTGWQIHFRSITGSRPDNPALFRATAILPCRSKV